MLASGIYFALAILFKPTVLFVLPALLPIQWTNNQLIIDWKKLVRIFTGLAILVILQALFFIINPSVFTQFVQSNLNPVENISMSVSVSYFLSLIYPKITIIALGLLAISFLWIAYERIVNKTDFTFCFMMAIMNTLLFYMISWWQYEVFVIPIVVMFIVANEKIKFSKREIIIIIAGSLLLYFLQYISIFIMILYIAFYIYAIVKIKQAPKKETEKNE